MNDKLKSILFLCTGNSCRSQMAEGLCNFYCGDKFKAVSAGVKKHGLNPYAVKVMHEIGIDISHHKSKLISELESQHYDHNAEKEFSFDYVVTVCSKAKDDCPYFPARVKKIHQSFDDPPALTKNMSVQKDGEEAILNVYRRVRDEIKKFILNIA